MDIKKVMALLLFVVIQSQASQITATIAADNAFALYTGNADGTDLTYIGRNTHDWYTADVFTFDHSDGNYIYLAAWSDASCAQGISGQFVVTGGPTILTGTDWEYHLTNTAVDHGNYMNWAPELSAVRSEINENDWSPVSQVIPGASSIWGARPGISASADWMWGTPLYTNWGEGEYQIFRIQVGTASVPEAGTLISLILGLTGLASLSFRRKS
jgi:hypothetical protein